MEDCKLATAAANWWVNLMKVRCQELYPDKVITDDSGIVIIDTSLFEAFSRFYEVLKNEIYFCLEKRNHLSLTCCCFIPASQLTRLARKASISTIFFPERASMQVYGTFVEVSLNGEDLHKLYVSAE